MLLQDKEFKPLRKSLQDSGYPLVLQPSKSIVLVRPDQYMAVVNSPALRDRTLKRYNVVIAESEEYLMEEVLLRMASRQRPRENKDERQELDLKKFDAKFVTKRTFICQAPMLLVAKTVIQSTTEAVRSGASASSLLPSNPQSNYFAHARSRNPRRCTPGMWGE